MTNEFTNEQINVALAKWHTKHDEKHEYGVWREYLNRVIIVPDDDLADEPLPLYTDSLDTMRLIEKLLTDEQWPVYSNEILRGGIYIVPKDILLAGAEQRARAAFKALGLGETNE